MRQAVITAALALGLAAPVAADVTLKQTTTGKGLGMSGTTTGTTYIKGAKMRADVVSGDTTRSTIFDLDAQKMYSFDSKKQEADVYDLSALQADLAKNTDVANIKAAIKPNRRSKSIAGKKATGYDVTVSVPTSMAGGEMSMTVNLSGPVWIVKGAPGTADWAGFYQQAAAKGFIVGDPRAAKGSPGQTRAMVEVYRKMAELGGIAYETEVAITFEGDGPMAVMIAKMGTVSSTSTVTNVKVGALADGLFAVPAGYKLKEHK